jgi:hypothetical protein
MYTMYVYSLRWSQCSTSKLHTYQYTHTHNDQYTTSNCIHISVHTHHEKLGKNRVGATLQTALKATRDSSIDVYNNDVGKRFMK